MTRPWIARTFVLVAAACTSQGAGDDGAEGGAGGKADDPEAGPPLAYRSYEVLFTNPVCRDYAFAPAAIPAVDGTLLTQKPKNVYCYSRFDKQPSAARPLSPQNRLISWIDATGAGDQIFLAYLSFSNSDVARALGTALGEGARVDVILDSEPSVPICSSSGACAHVERIGHVGGIGYQHNKVILINPDGPGPGDPDPEYMRMAVSSGNMSSGVVLHHENWHFIEVKRESYFAQVHGCLKNALMGATVELDGEEVVAHESLDGYAKYLEQCRADVVGRGLLPESDIRVFFIPTAEDTREINELLTADIRSPGGAGSVDVAVHRFGHTRLVSALRTRLAGDPGFQARMVADDDLYWLKPAAGPPHQPGDNLAFEADNVARLEEAGGDRFEIRYLETFHHLQSAQERPLLHHSKYVLFRDGEGQAYQLVFGAANLTNAGYGISSGESNFENIYFTRLPGVLRAFDEQYRRMWDAERMPDDAQAPPVATPVSKMPASDVAPTIQ